jgi:hypothetical protein
MKKIIAGAVTFALVVFNGYMLLEGAVTNAATTTVTSTGSASLNWDVYLDVSTEISLTCENTNMYLGTINGMTGGNLQQDRDCNVKTNNSGGWQLTINATNTPAMINTTTPTNYFSDRSQTVGAWSNLAASSTFGFAASSSYDGATGFDSLVTGYSGFNGLTPIVVATDADPTAVAGVTTTFRFRAEVGSSRNQPTGIYAAHVVVTAINL